MNHCRREPADLQSAPFDRSGNPPKILAFLLHSTCRADEGNRTLNLLFTKQVLCRLSYASDSSPSLRLRIRTQLIRLSSARSITSDSSGTTPGQTRSEMTRSDGPMHSADARKGGTCTPTCRGCQATNGPKPVPQMILAGPSSWSGRRPVRCRTGAWPGRGSACPPDRVAPTVLGRPRAARRRHCRRATGRAAVRARAPGQP